MPTIESTQEQTVEIDFEVFCATCGAGICNNTNVDSGYRYPRVYVNPCETCLDQAKSEGYEQGREDMENELASGKVRGVFIPLHY